MDNVERAESYYRSFAGKDVAGITSLLDPDVVLVNPLAEVKGREAVVTAAKRLMETLQAIDVVARFSSGDDVMLVYDMRFAPPMSGLRAAAWMRFTGERISRIELLFDPRAFIAASPAGNR